MVNVQRIAVHLAVNLHANTQVLFATQAIGRQQPVGHSDLPGHPGAGQRA